MSKNLKVVELPQNSRNMLAMAIEPNKAKTKIYLHGVSLKTGEDQWYESKGIYTKSTALSYFYAKQYQVVFHQGMTKSKVTGWF